MAQPAAIFSREQMLALEVIWVGGWGFLFFEYPKFVCRIFRQEPTENRLRNVRRTGGLELAIVFVSAMCTFAWSLFSK
jgi:hypothetical protein